MIRKVQAKNPQNMMDRWKSTPLRVGSWDTGRATAQQVGASRLFSGPQLPSLSSKGHCWEEVTHVKRAEAPDSVQSCLPHLRGWASVSLGPHLCPAELGSSRTTDRPKPGANRGRGMERLGVAQTSHERAVSYWVSRWLAV